MANEEHLKIIRQGVAAWNDWRVKNRELEPDLRGADLKKADLTKADLSEVGLSYANLRGAVLIEANLSEADLVQADLIQADLSGARLSRTALGYANLFEAVLRGANLIEATFRGAELSEADLRWANLSEADLSGANLTRVNLRWADLSGANLSGANLSGANLSRANLSGARLRVTQLIATDLCGATLTGSSVYGASVWDIKVDERTKQQNLIITDSDSDEPVITVDNIKVAQFIYLMLNNQEIRDVIDTITSKAVLILGRFSEERKRVLDAIRDELRNHNYLPIMFDFEATTNQATLETINTLASMARFVIADLTDARSVLMELGVIVPALPSVAVRLLIKKAAPEYGMLDFIRKFSSVVKDTFEYDNEQEVIASINAKIILPAEAKVRELRQRD